jgi:hypothetical protein
MPPNKKALISKRKKVHEIETHSSNKRYLETLKRATKEIKAGRTDVAEQKMIISDLNELLSDSNISKKEKKGILTILRKIKGI